MANIDTFKSRFTGGGARANQFKVLMTFPDVATTGGGGPPGASSTKLMDDLSFLCKSSKLPGQSIGVTPVKFRGRTLKLAGDSREFTDWDLDIYNDTNFELFNAFEKWLNAINNMSDNSGVIDTSLYQSTAEVIQLDRDGEPLKTMKFIGCWPTKTADIALDYETENALEKFDVTLAYQWYETSLTT